MPHLPSYKLSVLITALILCVLEGHAQLEYFGVPNDLHPTSNRALGLNIVDNQVYVGGDLFYRYSPYREVNIGIYDNGKLIEISNDSIGFDLYLKGFTPMRMQNLAGRFYVFGFGGLIYMDKDTIWKEIVVSDRYEYRDGLVTSLLPLGGDSMLIGGNFDSIGGVYTGCIALYDGTDFHSFHRFHEVADHPNGSFIYAMARYKGDYYVAGNFYLDKLPSREYVDDLAMWNGKEWTSVGGSIKPSNGLELINDMLVYKDKLYVAGYYDHMGGRLSKSLSVWDGRSWSTPTGLPDNGLDPGGYIQSLYLDGDTLYMTGNFLQLGGDSAYSMARLYDGRWEYDQNYKGNSLGQVARKDDTLFVVTGGGGARLNGDSCDGGHQHGECPYLLRMISHGFRTDAILATEQASTDHTDIHIYPSPVQDIIVLSGYALKNVTDIRLYNTLGELTRLWHDPHTQLSTEGLAAGLYFLELQMRKEPSRIVRKLVITR